MTPDIWRTFDLAALAKQGSWPVAGGFLDQPAVYFEAVELIWDLEKQLSR